jgi:hypothetical protein
MKFEYLHDTIDTMPIQYSEIVQLINQENLQGADVTIIIDEILNHYEIASRINLTNTQGIHYRDLLSQLIKRYGH